MEQVNSSPTFAMLQAAIAQAQLPKAGKSNADGEFQKLMDKTASGSKTPARETDKATAPSAGKTEQARPQEKEELDDDAKALGAYMVAVPKDVLAQYPPEWLPLNLQEGEPVVCVGVRTGVNGENIPVLMGADEAAGVFGKQVVDPTLYDVSDPQADAMLEATAPGADNSPAALLEKIAAEQFGKVVEQPQEEAQSQEGKDGIEMELLDVEQAPQRLFHDVKAVPVKVGEVYNAEQTEGANVAQQIDAGLAQAMQQGESLVRIQLNPESLGSVTIEISQSAEGVLRVALNAHSGETRGLLERHADELQGLLASRTQQSVEIDVQRQAESQQGQNQQHEGYDGRNGHAQDGQERRRQQQEQTDSRDFIQQLRLGLISEDGDA